MQCLDSWSITMPRLGLTSITWKWLFPAILGSTAKKALASERYPHLVIVVSVATARQLMKLLGECPAEGRMLLTSACTM